MDSFNYPDSESEFNDQWFNTQSYSEYVESFDEQKQKQSDEILIIEKSLKDGKPDLRFATDNDLRKTLMGGLAVINVIIMVTAIVGAVSVAREFSKGTIRLLLIRPVTRTKVILSKFISVVIWAFLLWVMSLILITIVAVLSGNGLGLFNPVYRVSGETAVAGSFILYYINSVATLFVPVVFVATLSVMWSAIVRNSTIAMILTIITPVVYSQIVLNDIGDMSMQTATESILLLGLGIYGLMVYSAIFVAIGIFTFKKRDIKN